MPVILPAGEAWDTWLEGETEKALELARPFPEGGLKVVATRIARGCVLGRLPVRIRIPWSIQRKMTAQAVVLLAGPI
jgi:hypothetical protein